MGAGMGVSRDCSGLQSWGRHRGSLWTASRKSAAPRHPTSARWDRFWASNLQDPYGNALGSF